LNLETASHKQISASTFETHISEKVFKSSFILGYQTSVDPSMLWIIHCVVWQEGTKFWGNILP
jgi:hypothetical protein